MRLGWITLACALAGCQTSGGGERLGAAAAFAKMPAGCFMRADMGDGAQYETKIENGTTLYSIKHDAPPLVREVGCLCNDQWRMNFVASRVVERALKAIADDTGSVLGNVAPMTGMANTYYFDATRSDMWGDVVYRGRAVFEGQCVQIVGAWGRLADVPALERFAAAAYDGGRATQVPAAPPLSVGRCRLPDGSEIITSRDACQGRGGTELPATPMR